MTFERRILHHGPTPTGTPVVLSMHALKKCWFELNRQGGCGAAELILANEFYDRDQVDIGDWISFEYKASERWYLGRVEERVAESPAQTRFRLEGMSIELNEVFPGGFGEEADGQKPHRYANTDLFQHDPDRDQETYDSIADAVELVKLLMQQYVAPQTHISYHPVQVEHPEQDATVTSLKFRGEESVRSVLKELAVRAQSASWGVDEQGKFFFLRRRDTPLAHFREGVDLTSLTEIRDREHLYNRLLLTGDYIYDQRDHSDEIARRSFRWRGNFVEPNSRAVHGERRLRIWLPWMRTQHDSFSFAKEFFRTYSQPQSRYLIETTNVAQLSKPWEGRYAVFDQAGGLLAYSYAETVRIYFDGTPRMRMELGPIHPRELWAEPPHDERWELPDQMPSAGGDVTLPPSIPVGDPPPPQPSVTPSPTDSFLSSLVSESLDPSALDSSEVASSDFTSSGWSRASSGSESESGDVLGSGSSSVSTNSASLVDGSSVSESSGQSPSASSEMESSQATSSGWNSQQSIGEESEGSSSSVSEPGSVQSLDESTQYSSVSSGQGEESSAEPGGSGASASSMSSSVSKSEQSISSQGGESSLGGTFSMSGETGTSNAGSEGTGEGADKSNSNGATTDSFGSWSDSGQSRLTSEADHWESTLDLSS
ncbi:hypothetical protein [Thalassoglobus polymorphus]|uniref:Uncharacterized protein n=1 Tax=Thalassoglobus polymorphus TaxID=2527994 RepID=A0A517QPV2_9PLAN|nr:hypothetical protein [Thalassoglobus polymorphus]QDT33627.1 hypothetical protein Mal48_28810 [Thalassoglobus polymorphus]